MVNSEIDNYFNFPEAKLVPTQLFQKALNSSGGQYNTSARCSTALIKYSTLVLSFHLSAEPWGCLFLRLSSQ